MERYYLQAVKMAACTDESYISALPVVRSLQQDGQLSLNQAVTFLVGEHGTGKSTLIEAIAVAAGYNAEGGSRNFAFSTRQTVSNLHHYITLVKAAYEQDGFFLRAESFYNVASQVDDLGVSLDGYGGKSLHQQSHGESFLALVQNRFRGQGLYLLDEPEAALSPLRQLTLLAEIHKLVQAQSQFIIATHSPILLAYPGATLYQITEQAIEQVAYEQCEHYQLTKGFLADPRRYMECLFAE